ncbi:hypothetical protein ACJZL1_05860 [Wolbachia endosymbiont of Rhagoletis indifferens]|uniref:hypothetical protein n=1 Tax=Wolbachia endosymbiont of Rhagoletis indifferens TaxID=3383250 RepID=UPI003AF37E9E
MLADEIPRRYDGSRWHDDKASSPRYVLAPWRYDGSWWHDDNFVIPLLVSGI